MTGAAAPRTATLETVASIRSDFDLTLIARVLLGLDREPTDVALEIVAPSGTVSC